LHAFDISSGLFLESGFSISRNDMLKLGLGNQYRLISIDGLEPTTFEAMDAALAQLQEGLKTAPQAVTYFTQEYMLGSAISMEIRFEILP